MRTLTRTLGLLLAATAACDRKEEPAVGGAWDPLGSGGSYEVVSGTVEPGKAHRVSRWFGRADAGDDLPAILSDAREALIAATPSRFTVQLAASGTPRRLRTSVRSLDPAGASPGGLVAEVFVTGDGAPRSAAVARLGAAAGAAAPWQDLAVDLAAGRAWKLDFVTRRADPARASETGPAVAWASPRIAPAVAAAEPAHPDVLILSVDTLRADALSSAPRLAAIASRGRLWTAAVSPSNWTLPAYASLFTATGADRHGAGRGPMADAASGQTAERDYRGIDPELPTLAEQFRRAGYRTAMFHQNPFLEPWSGLDRGFARYARTRDDPQVAVREARRWWHAESDRPRLLVLHVLGPHLPHADPPAGTGVPQPPPDPLAALDWRGFLGEDHTLAERRAFFDLSPEDRHAVRQRYHAEVAVVDAVVAPWLEELLSAAPAPLFVLHSDHGEELWDAGSFEHGHSFIDAVVRVPLAVVGPGVPDAFDATRPVRVLDLGPSLLEWAGLPVPPAWQGRLDAPPAALRCIQPLYRAEHGGRVVRQGEASPEWIPFSAPEASASGRVPALDPELQRALAALGYGGEPGEEPHR